MESTITQLEVSQEVKAGIAQVVTAGWNTVNSTVKQRLTDDFISSIVKSDYLKYLTTPGESEPGSITYLSV